MAQDTLVPDTTIVSCPFSLVITPELSRKALSLLMDGSAVLNVWTERQLICAYICFHWLCVETSTPDHLKHTHYLNTLPSSNDLRTPLHFTSDELDAFNGTNLYGATVDRECSWRSEWQACKTDISSNRENYLTASTYMSSRAFPSTLLSKEPTLKSTPSSYPVLIPGVDSLNHCRGLPISWVVSFPEPVAISTVNSTKPTVSLVGHTITQAGQEVFNNYGPKPNSELILGYGFSLPQNQDDTIVLQIGGAPTSSRKKWEVGRKAHGAEGVWEEVLGLIAQGAEATYEDELEAADVLSEMLTSLIEHLPEVSDADDDKDIRPEVELMMEHYLEGQRSILDSLLEFIDLKRQSAIEAARDQGIEIILDDED
ncbi:hypothetical protein SERLA73DRAFT_165797 [Serpula lacrymans var. lacrymans S7.3]|uniref:SET domain-containing protein n=1 Tax=Serpula lacrymans var. lacrymans (strain S7.3) TaxID=936435 RepID=F8PMM8_SERL3|nr:hypothetical protein SERLA73DRAFT_165797 [Serpula lacrymans var. lacrymans S7.3]